MRMRAARILIHIAAGLLAFAAAWTAAVYALGFMYHRFRPSETHEVLTDADFANAKEMSSSEGRLHIPSYSGNFYFIDPLLWRLAAEHGGMWGFEYRTPFDVTLYEQPSGSSPVAAVIAANEPPGDWQFLLTLPCGEPGWRAVPGLGYCRESVALAMHSGYNLYEYDGDGETLLNSRSYREYFYSMFYSMDVFLWETGLYKVPGYFYNRPANFITAVVWTLAGIATAAAVVLRIVLRKGWRKFGRWKLVYTVTAVLAACALVLDIYALRDTGLNRLLRGDRRDEWIFCNFYGGVRSSPHKYFDDFTYSMYDHS